MTDIVERLWQAKDVPDAWFLALVDRLATDGRYGPDRRWVMRYEVEEQLHVVPWKVLLAKARALMKRGLLDGCGCGCRGDYVLTPAGVQFLSDLATGLALSQQPRRQEPGVRMAEPAQIVDLFGPAGLDLDGSCPSCGAPLDNDRRGSYCEECE